MPVSENKELLYLLTHQNQIISAVWLYEWREPGSQNSRDFFSDWVDPETISPTVYTCTIHSCTHDPRQMRDRELEKKRKGFIFILSILLSVILSFSLSLSQPFQPSLNLSKSSPACHNFCSPVKKYVKRLLKQMVQRMMIWRRRMSHHHPTLK